MAAYNPEQDKVLATLLVASTTPTEETRVRVRRYDSPEGAPGEEKLEVSRWRRLKSGGLKPKAGIRLTRIEAAALAAALLEVPYEEITLTEGWGITVR